MSWSMEKHHAVLDVVEQLWGKRSSPQRRVRTFFRETFLPLRAEPTGENLSSTCHPDVGPNHQYASKIEPKVSDFGHIWPSAFLRGET